MEKTRLNKLNKLLMLLRKLLNKPKQRLMRHRQKPIMKAHLNLNQLLMQLNKQLMLHNNLPKLLKPQLMQLNKQHLKEIHKVHSKLLKMQYLMQIMLKNLEMKHSNRPDNKIVNLIEILIQH